MISGIVNARNETTFSFAIQDTTGKYHDFETLLDTGFAGTLSLPLPVISVLGLRWHSQTRFLLANDQSIWFDNYQATIVWNGTPQAVLIQAIDNVPLLGTNLLVGHELRIRFTNGGPAEIEALP